MRQDWTWKDVLSVVGAILFGLLFAIAMIAGIMLQHTRFIVVW